VSALRHSLSTVALASAVVVGALVVAQDATTAASPCPATTLTRSGAQSTGIDQSNTDGAWDLTSAVWDRAGITYPIRSDSWSRGCITGGSVLGDIPRSATRDQWYDGADGGAPGADSEGFRQSLTNTTGNYLTITNSSVSDVEDAFDPNAARADSVVTLDHVKAESVRDDCIENEGGTGTSETPGSLVITRSLFDGCFTAFAERPSGASTAQNGTGASSFTLTDSLVYVQPQPLGPRYCSPTHVSRGRCTITGTNDVWLGSYGIWKWSTAAAGTVVVRDTIFRLDMPSYSSCSSQKWPAGSYQNVTLVWTNPQPYATAGDCSNTLPPGVTLTTDVSVWDNAKAAWLTGTAPSPPATATPTVAPTATPTVSPTATPTPSGAATPTVTATPTPTPTVTPTVGPTKKPNPCRTRWVRAGQLWNYRPCR
jgi:hypothetical protein